MYRIYFICNLMCNQHTNHMILLMFTYFLLVVLAYKACVTCVGSFPNVYFYATRHITFFCYCWCFHYCFFRFPILIHNRNKLSIPRLGFCSLLCTDWECRISNEISSCLLLLYAKWWGFIIAIPLLTLNPVILHSSNVCWTTRPSPVVTNLKLDGLFIKGIGSQLIIETVSAVYIIYSVGALHIHIFLSVHFWDYP